MEGLAKATLVNSSIICLSSTLSLFRKFLLAGTLKNKFLILIEVPLFVAQFSWVLILLPSIFIKVPNSVSLVFVLSSTCEIAAIEAIASPLNPIDLIEYKSSASLIFEVA